MVVLDPFLGGGTTAESAEALGRQWTGIELNPDYIQIAKQRIDRMLADPKPSCFVSL
ncbi:MAG: site-specific DNA-methyltransferase [Chthoniobacterales bacterium]|nr:site-specific DNA-methyltransferase [Chthoniobacterales bacterium]